MRKTRYCVKTRKRAVQLAAIVVYELTLLVPYHSAGTISRGFPLALITYTGIDTVFPGYSLNAFNVLLSIYFIYCWIYCLLFAFGKVRENSFAPTLRRR